MSNSNKTFIKLKKFTNKNQKINSLYKNNMNMISSNIKKKLVNFIK